MWEDSEVKVFHFIDLGNKVSPFEQNSHGIGCMLWPPSCQADLAFWQNLLPQVLRSPRTSREHGTSLFPIFRAANRSQKKISCWVLPKSPSLDVTSATTTATTAVCPSDWPAVTVPEFTGAFPAVWAVIFIPLFLHPHTNNPWEPLILAPVQKHFVLLFIFYFSITCHQIILSEIIGRPRDLFSQVNRQCESSHGAAGQHVGFRGLILTEVICGSPASRPSWHNHCLLRQKAWDFPYIHLAVLAADLIRE